MELILDILEDAARDTLVLVPFLFLTYVALELLEHAAGPRLNATVRRAGAAGPVIGAVLGMVPQCGFSAMGATLYAGRVVTFGTLAAVFLSTSDEMLPLLVAERLDVSLLAGILLAKAAIAAVVGIAADLALRALRHAPRLHGAVRRGVLGAAADPSLVDDMAEAGEGAEHIHELCERDHCACDHGHGHSHGHGHGHEHGHDHHEGHGLVAGVLRAALSHTVQVTVFVFLVTLVLAGVLDTVGEGALTQFLSSNEVLAVFASALVGVIPNCAASVVITQLYLEGALAFGPMMAGSLMAAGAGYLVLFRTNRRVRENVVVLCCLYAASVVCGLVLTLVA